MTRNDIIQKEAENLVNHGVYDDVDDAWQEAEAICEAMDKFACLDDSDWY